jgi:hypothetical protein
MSSTSFVRPASDTRKFTMLRKALSLLSLTTRPFP